MSRGLYQSLRGKAPAFVSFYPIVLAISVVRKSIERHACCSLVDWRKFYEQPKPKPE
jgi:hypothetical protein